MTKVSYRQYKSETELQSVQNVNVILPVGGFATRALEITQDKIPKHLIRLKSGDTVLDQLLRGLQREGYQNFVFCTGYHSEAIDSHLAKESWKLNDNTNWTLSHEENPLGPDGAVMNAIDDLKLEGEALILPGDVSLPWDKLAAMSLYRRVAGSDVTVAVTSIITPRTTDVGKLIVNKSTSQLEHCYGRDETVPDLPSTQEALTSAAAFAIDIQRYVALYEAYLVGHPGITAISMRDGIAPWASHDTSYNITAYDIQGEILDFGIPANIIFGQRHFGE